MGSKTFKDLEPIDGQVLEEVLLSLGVSRGERDEVFAKLLDAERRSTAKTVKAAEMISLLHQREGGVQIEVTIKGVDFRGRPVTVSGEITDAMHHERRGNDAYDRILACINGKIVILTPADDVLIFDE